MTATKTFQSLDIRESSTKEMSRVLQDMIEVLEGLESCRLPDRQEYTCDDLRAYLVSLVESQRGELALGHGSQILAGSWSINSFCEDMPSDARVDFIFFPTYVAVATISRCLLEFPLLAASVPGLAPALQRGLEFACHRELAGHGREAAEDKRKALNLFYLGWVPLLLWQNPDFCPRMNRILEGTENCDFHVEYEMKQQFALYHGLHRREQERREARRKVEFRRSFGSEPKLLTREHERETDQCFKSLEEKRLEDPGEEELGAALERQIEEVTKNLSDLVISDETREIWKKHFAAMGSCFEKGRPQAFLQSHGEVAVGSGASGSDSALPPITPHVPRPGRPVRDEVVQDPPEGAQP
jgi:hypothetical protein